MSDHPTPPPLTPGACANVINWMHTEPEPMRWLIEMWVPEGCCGIFKAQGGVGKSNLAIAMSLALAGGMGIGPFRPALGPQRVLLISGEDGQKALHRRLFHARRLYRPTESQLALFKKNLLIFPARETVGHLMRMDENGNPVPTEFMAWLAESVTSLDPSLVILDTKSRFFGLPEENSNTLNSAFLRAIEKAVVTETRSCLILHHTGKVAPGKEMDADGGRGGSSTGDDARFIIAAASLSGKEARRLNLDPESHFVARPVKQSYGPLAPAAYFRRETDGVPVHVLPVKRALEALVKEIVRWLQDDVKGRGVTRREFTRGERDEVKKLRRDVAKAHYHGKKTGVAQDLEMALAQAMEGGKVIIAQEKGSSSGFITLSK